MSHRSYNVKAGWKNPRTSFAVAPPVADEYLRKILKARIYEVVKMTPCNKAPSLSMQTGNDVHFKREDMQDVYSFKIRGAFNKIKGLTDDQRELGVIACSAGNHAQGVALSARALDIQATVVMPLATPNIKVDAVRRHGGDNVTVVLHGQNYDECSAEAYRLRDENNLTLIHPYDDPDVIAGQGTIGMELMQQMDDIDAVFLCCGGGGLLAGVASYIKALKPNIKIIGCEADDAAGMTASLIMDEVTTLPTVGLFADGAAVRTVGTETFRICRELVDEMVTVNTDEICAAIKAGFNDTRGIMEPAGALAIAGLTKYVRENEWKGKNVVAICSGANIDFDRLRFVTQRADSREVLMSVDIPDRPGQFLKMYELVAPRNVTGLSYRFDGTATAKLFLTFQVPGSFDVEDDATTVKNVLEAAGMPALNLQANEMAKAHGRYLSGGRVRVENEMRGFTESLYRFEFPEAPGALSNFLRTLHENNDGRWSITLFHYRNHGHDFGRVLVGLVVPDGEEAYFNEFLKNLGYVHFQETENPVYEQFLR